jgi:mono/diheme cytochrome c family protein
MNNMKKKSRIIIYPVVTAIMIILLFNACTYNKEDELYAQPCDTTAVTYNNNIQQILQNDCLSCHGAQNYQSDGGGKNLDGYTNAVSSSSRILSRAIDKDNPMPPFPYAKLSSCKINQIRAWINQGKPE